MTKHRTTHALLAVVVALLGLHLALRLSPREATAQEPEFNVDREFNVEPEPPAVRVIQIEPSEGNDFYRLWSDGVIERNRFENLNPCSGDPWCGWEAIPDDVPRGQGVRIIQIASQSSTICRFWSDGMIERNTYSGSATGCDRLITWCGWQTVPE